MGLTHTSRQSERRYPPKNLWRVIPELFRQDFSYTVNEPKDFDSWELAREKCWYPIFDTIKEMETGKGMGDLKSLHNLVFFEMLGLFDNPYIRMAGGLMAKPITEDFYHRDGIRDLVEEFFLRRYGIAPNYTTVSTPGRCIVKIPGLIERLKIGHPSPRVIKADYLKLFKRLYSIEGSVQTNKDLMVFSVRPTFVTPHNHTDSDFVQIGKELLEVIENRGIYS